MNAVAFGAIKTRMLVFFVGEAKTENAQRAWLESEYPVGRMGTAEGAAQAVIGLLENPFISGSILTVDGGGTEQ